MGYFDPPAKKGSKKAGPPSLYNLSPKRRDSEKREGLFGTGIGPKFNLGVTTALSDLAKFVPAAAGLAADLAPGGNAAGERWSQVGKGMLSSIAGTALTPIHAGSEIGARLHPGDDFSAYDAAGRRVGRALGDEEAFKARSFFETTGERGLVPGVVEHVGNVAIVGSAPSAPARLGSKVAKLTGNTEKAVSLAQKAEALSGAAHPYRNLAKSIRGVATKPAAERLLAASGRIDESVVVPERPPGKDLRNQAAAEGIDVGGPVRHPETGRTRAQINQRLKNLKDPDARGRYEAELADLDAIGPDTPKLKGDALHAAVDPEGAAARQAAMAARVVPPDGSTPGRITKGLAAVENKLAARDTVRQLREQTRLADIERKAASRSPAVRQAVRAAQDRLIQGAGVSRRLAKQIVDFELHKGSELGSFLEDEFPGVPQETLDSVYRELGYKPARLPADVDPQVAADFGAAMDETRATFAAEKTSATAAAADSRIGMKGLEDVGSDAPRPTKREAALRARAEKLVAKAQSEALARRQAREAGTVKTALAKAHDKLGELAEESRRISNEKLAAGEAFDHARTWVPKAFRSPAAMRQAATDIVLRTLEDGGSTYDPHAGAFLVPGQAKGHSVGLVTGTAVRAASSPEVAAATGLPMLTPELVESFVGTYEGIYQHPNTGIGTWVDGEGVVHLDPIENVSNIDDALIRAAARGQEAIFDLGGSSEIQVPLQLRPDIAAHFLAKSVERSRIARQARALVGKTALWDEDIDRAMAVTDRFAVAAWEKGKVAHPDDYYKTIKALEFGARPSSLEGVLRQAAENLGLNKNLRTPEARAKLWSEIKAAGFDIDKAAFWYRDSHDWIEKTFRDKGDITLLNGKKINVADLFYQLLAVTSTNNAPITNLPDALVGLNHLVSQGAKLRQAWGNILGRVSAGKLTLEEALDEMFGASDEAHPASGRSGDKSARSGKPKHGSTPGLPTHPLFEQITGGVHHAEIAKEMAAEILLGNTMDTWTPEYMAERTAKLWGRHPKRFTIPGPDGKMVPVSFAEARKWVETQIPEAVAELGADRAVLEYFGSELSAKVISFWDNLARPEASKAVTMDRWMKGLFGNQLSKPGEWLEFSNQVRAMADEYGLPAGEMQAVLWVYAFKMAGKDPSLAASFGELVNNPKFHTTKKGEPSAFAGHMEKHRPLLEADRFFQVGPRRPRTFRTAEEAIDAEWEDLDAVGPGETGPLYHGTSRDFDKFRSPEEVGVEDAFINTLVGNFFADNPRIAESYAKRGNDPKIKRAKVKGDFKHFENEFELDRDLVQHAIDTGVITAEDAAQALENVAAIQRRFLDTSTDSGRIADLRQDLAELEGRIERIRSGEDTSWRQEVANQFSKRHQVSDEQARKMALGYREHLKGQGFAGVSFDGKGEVLGAAGRHYAIFEPDAIELFQRFESTIRGEYVPLPDEARGIIRIFEDGNFDTLVHENGHHLRRMLGDAEMRAVETAYGIKDGKWSVPHEERFADDLLRYMNGDGAPKGLESAFARIKELIGTVWEYAKASFHRDRVHPEVAAVLDEWFNPTELPVNAVADVSPEGVLGLPEIPASTGTMRQQAARAPKFPEPPAGSKDLYRAGKLSAEAVARTERLEARQRLVDATRAQVQKTVTDLEATLADNRLPAQLERAGLVAEAGKLLAKAEAGAKNPSLAATPAKWQPLLHAVRSLAAKYDGDPGVAQALADMSQDLPRIIEAAQARGFDPSHVRHFTPDQVKTLMFGSMRLGLGRELGKEVAAGTRKTRQLRVGPNTARSLEALTAAIVEVQNEVRTNKVVDWIETSVARRIPAGAEVPQGWRPWDPVRQYLMTGEEINPATGKAMRTVSAETAIIPEAVYKTLHRHTKAYDHWAPQMLAKVTNPWRAFVLTLSPGWYVRNFVGNAMLAVAAGVSVADWKAAWREYQKKDEFGAFADLPLVGRGGIGQDLDLGGESLLPGSRSTLRDPLGGVRGVREAAQAGAGRPLGRTRSVLADVQRRMVRANEVVDEFARAAVYHKGLRQNLSEEAAIHLANEALVDYGALSGFERSIVRAIVPFYAWQKGILKVVLRQAMDHPARTNILMQLGQMQDEYISDRLGLESEDIPEGMKHLIGDRNVRSFNPFADSGSLLSPEGIAQSMNPFLEIGVRKGLGAPEFFPEQYRLGPFGTAQADVNVAGELGALAAGVPGARALGIGQGGREVPELGTRVGRFLGAPATVDDAALRQRLLKARKQVRGIANPQTGSGGSKGFFEPAGRR